MNNKVIIIIGPTASGKTSLAVRTAKKLKGEIISADSRQVYRGMDIGSGKDLREYGKVPYHLIDIASPKRQVTVAEWQKKAYAAIDDILQRGKVPIVCGGTGLYIKALVEGFTFSDVTLSSSKGVTKNMVRQAHHDKRKTLQKKTLKQLLALLKKVDSQTYSEIDKNNRRRVQRALEIYYETGVPKSKAVSAQKPKHDFEIIKLDPPKKVLHKRIEKRLKERLRQGMVAEVKRLHHQGVSWKRLESFGLEYKYCSLYLQKKLSKKEMEEQLLKAITDFAKRQKTWFKKF